MRISPRDIYLIVILSSFSTIIFIILNKNPIILYKQSMVHIPVKEFDELPNPPIENWRNLSKPELGKLSMLGQILYNDKQPPVTNQSKTYEILVWKYGTAIEKRHMKQWGREIVDPFEECLVNNCKITYEDAALKTADIVLFHLHRMKNGEIPKREVKSQIWAFLTDESPYHTFLSANDLSKYDGIFNWSMTYRMDADIPVPYGRTILRKEREEETKITKRRDVLVTILGSNCGSKNKRWEYVKELQKHMQVDIYGNCGPLKICAGHFQNNCPSIDDYLFYLAFENSNCNDYITEKLWWNAFSKNSIPIVMGANPNSYRRNLPPKSYINIQEFATPKDLATFILYLNTTNKYQEYYTWKQKYKILNEHGYFKSRSYHYCRVCEALNFNSKEEKIYVHPKSFWDSATDCSPPWNA